MLIQYKICWKHFHALELKVFGLQVLCSSALFCSDTAFSLYHYTLFSFLGLMNHDRTVLFPFHISLKRAKTASVSATF